MSYTKRQFVTAAYSELGLGDYQFDLDPEQLQMAMRRLDSMVAEWNGRGIRLAYPLPESPELSDLDEKTDVPDWANEAVILNLAVRIAPSFGKMVSSTTLINAKSAIEAVISRQATPQEMSLPCSMPAGSGHKRDSDPFIDPAESQIQAGPDGALVYD